MQKIEKLQVVALVLGTWCLSVCAERQCLLKEVDDVETQVHEKKSQFEQEGDCELLEEAYALVSSLHAHQGHKDWGSVCDRVLRLGLIVLEKCFTARDHTYDLEDHPPIYTRPFPPVAPGAYMGMRPEEVKDPGIRKTYEEDIAENNRRKAKLRREKSLQDLIQAGVLDMRIYMLNIQREPDKHDRTRAVIETGIEDEALKKRLLDLFDEILGKDSDAEKKCP